MTTDDNSIPESIVFWRWFFEPLSGDVNKMRIWMWWEQRRLIYNIIVIATAVCSFAAYAFFLLQSGHLSPGEDLEEPIGLLFGMIVGPIAWNICYSLGPIVEVARHMSGVKPCGPFLLKIGIAISVVVLCIPSGIWFIIWLKEAAKRLIHGG